MHVSKICFNRVETFKKISVEVLINVTFVSKEFLQHSSLWSNQYVSGAGGDGHQLFRPEGIKNKHEVKTDTLPAYCNPPNPCPVGYTGNYLLI